MNTLKPAFRAQLDEFLRLASPENIRDLLIDVQDHILSPSKFLDGAPMTDLVDQIGEIEDAIWEYNNSPEREVEAREAWAERLADERRDEAMINQWEKDHAE